jgi:Domain of unknown function (DUF4160)
VESWGVSSDRDLTPGDLGLAGLLAACNGGPALFEVPQRAKFWLAPVALARNLGFTAVELRRVQRLVAEHEPRLLEAWNEYFRGSTG